MYYKKGLVIPALGTVLIIITIILLMFLGALSSSMEGGIIQKGGKSISLSNYVEFWKKSITESSEIISRRSAYELGKTGGISGSELLVWNSTYPYLGILKEQLESKIKDNLPKSSIGIGRIVTFEEGNICIYPSPLGDTDFDSDVDMDDMNKCVAIIDSTPEKPNWDDSCDLNCNNKIDIGDITTIAANIGNPDTSKSFTLYGNKSFSINDKTIDSTVHVSNDLKSKISSSYFRLLYVGRQILENSRYNTILHDAANLQSRLQSDFPNLEFEIIANEVTIRDKSCLPTDYYCLVPLKPEEPGIIFGGKQIPFDYLELKFKDMSDSDLGDFIVSLNPISDTIIVGNPVAPKVTVSGVSTSPVTLSISGCPGGATCLFSINSGNPLFTSTLTITNAPLGTHTITITGTNGTTSHSKPYSLMVSPPSCHCSLGTPDETDCGHCAGPTTSKQPSWCDGSGSWVSNQCNAPHNCACPSSLPICNADGSCRAPPFTYTLSVNPSTGTATQGVAFSKTITITMTKTGGTPQAVSLSTAGSIQGITMSLPNPPSCTPNPTCTSQFTLTGNPTVPNTYITTVTATSAGSPSSPATAIFTLVVNSPPPCTCSDGTSCGQCAITEAFKPRWCDNNGIWLTNACIAPHNCQCPSASPICKPDGTCKACTCSDGTPCGQCAITNAFKPSWCDSNGNWINLQCGAPHNCPCAGTDVCNHVTGMCEPPCHCLDGTPCNSCAITEANKPSWCDNNGIWLTNACIAPHNCQCPSANPICKPDGTCRAMGSGCFCGWTGDPNPNRGYACGISPTTSQECIIAIWWWAWWKKCECVDSNGDPNPGCGIALGKNCGGLPEFTEICRNNVVLDPACDCPPCGSPT